MTPLTTTTTRRRRRRKRSAPGHQRRHDTFALRAPLVRDVDAVGRGLAGGGGREEGREGVAEQKVQWLWSWAEQAAADWLARPRVEQREDRTRTTTLWLPWRTKLTKSHADDRRRSPHGAAEPTQSIHSKPRRGLERPACQPGATLQFQLRRQQHGSPPVLVPRLQ